MRNRITQLLTFLGSFAACFFALTPTVFAAAKVNPVTGDNNMVPVVIGLLVVSAVVIVALLLLSGKKKRTLTITLKPGCAGIPAFSFAFFMRENSLPVPFSTIFLSF